MIDPIMIDDIFSDVDAYCKLLRNPYKQYEYASTIYEVVIRIKTMMMSSEVTYSSLRKIHLRISTEFEAHYEKHHDDKLRQYINEILNYVDEWYNECYNDSTICLHDTYMFNPFDLVDHS